MKLFLCAPALLLAAGFASAQYPYGVMPVNGPQTLPQPAQVSAGPVSSTPASGGCAGGNCGGSAQHGSHFGHSSGCNTCSAGFGHKFLGWWKSPSPLNAPTIRQPLPPLAFQTHPYARSPRDYFMQEEN